MTLGSENFGRKGEEAAVRFLKKRGYRILETNFRIRAGEIDIIAEQGRVLVFVEVKARAGERYGQAVQAVGPRKAGKIGQVARAFLARHPQADRDCRFDIVTITGEPARPEEWQLELIADAFRF